MAEKLKHLPTKPTMIHPQSGKRPFVRKQHYNPNDKPSGRERSGGEEQPNNTRKSGAPISPLLKLQLNKEKNIKPESKISFDEIQPKTNHLKNAESVMNSKMPENISVDNKFEPVGTNTVNGVYTFVGEEGQRFFWKPREEEGVGMKRWLENDEFSHALNKNGVIRDTIKDNFGGREVASYELSKLLGVEGLVPPTKEFNNPVEGGEYHGPAQMSVYDFGTKILGHEKVKSVTEIIDNEKLKQILNKADNASDMIAFDFITGNTDRHGGNFFVSKKSNDEYHLIANDNGLSFPEHKGDIFHVDWENTLFNTQSEYYKTDSRSKPISDDFLSGVLEFDENAFRKMATKNGIGKDAQDGVVHRIELMRKSIKRKYIAATEKHADREQASIEERRSVLKQETSFTGDDLEKLVKTEIMNPIRENGEQKYTQDVMGTTQQRPKDQLNQIKSVFDGDWDED